MSALHDDKAIENEADEVDANIQLDTDVPFVTYAEIRSYEFIFSLIFEFLGVMLFSFIGTSVGAAMPGKPGTLTWADFTPIIAPLANGIALAVLIYVCGTISGGHLNPAVTMSMCFCGYYPIIHTFCYVGAQIIGGIFGSLLTARLLPHAAWGAPPGYYIGATALNGPGCVDGLIAPRGPLDGGQIFGWEVLMTFVLVATVWACGVAKPGSGSLTPIAVGFSLLACALAGGQWTGAQLNPARAIGPAVVFKCGKHAMGYYIGAELLAGFCAAMLFATVFGPGPLMPLVFRIPIKKALKKNTRLDEIEAKTDTFAKDMHDWIMGLETKGDPSLHAKSFSRR